MRATMVALFVLLWPFLAVADQEIPPQPSGGGDAKATAMVADPDYVPKVGDRAVLYSPDSTQVSADLWCATTSQACKDFIKGLLTDDKVAADNLAAAKAIVYLEPRTEIQVLTRDSFQVDAGSGEEPLPCTCLAVLVLTGPSKGTTLYTMDYHVTRPIQAPTPARPGTGGAGSPARTTATPPRPSTNAAPPSVGVSPGLPASGGTVAATAAPSPATTRTELPIPLTSPVDAPRPTPRPAVAAESGGVISLDSLVPPGEPSPAPATVSVPAPGPAQAPPTAHAPAAAVAAAESGGVISLDSLAPVRPSSPARTAPPVAANPRVITLESPGTTAPAPAPAPLPAAPAPAAQQARAVPPAVATAPRTEDVLSLDSLTPGASAPSQPVEPIQQAPPGIPPVLAPERVSAPSLPVRTAPAPPRPRVAVARAPSPRPLARPSPEPVPVATRVERLVPSNPPAPVDAELAAPAPPPLSAAGMLATATELDREGKRLEAIAGYRALVKSHAGTRQANLAATRIGALTTSLEVEAQEARAAIVLKRAADLEESGNVALALTYFRQVVKVYPRTPSARTATERINALGGGSPPAPR